MSDKMRYEGEHDDCPIDTPHDHPGTMNDLYAVAYTDETIEFFWAEDASHAIEQARDSRPNDEVYTVALVPPIYTNQAP